MASKTPKPSASDPKTAGSLLGESFGNAVKRLPIFGNMAATAMAGGTGGAIFASGALGAVSMFGKALGEVKSVFIDPVISAAKGGFQTGLSKGSGIEVLGRSFEYLGAIIGGMFAPNIVRVSALILTLADRMQNFSGKIEKFGVKYMDFVDKYAGWHPVARMMGIGDWRSSQKSMIGDPEKYIKNLEISSDTLKMSLLGGQKGGYSDLSNVRDQIQMSAQEDPMTKKFREQMLSQVAELDMKVAELIAKYREAK